MNLPTGTVTFLFTDIEGSTKLWEQRPEAMRTALARHDSLLRQAIEDNNGVVFKTVGDAFCAAFATAPQALAAALAAHLLLQKEEWGETTSLQVRMGLHTGEAQERDGDYFGQTLNRVARLQAVGHGQQILLSQATYQLVYQNLLPEVTLRDMGQQRLKDLLAPEHVWQLCHPTLPSEFPPLKSLDYLPTNLPRQMTSFIGREREMGEIKRLLSATPLLTLVGSGGAGKTRLAVQVGADVLDTYKDGVWLVELAALSDASLVPQAVASVLGLREEAGRSLVQIVQDHLRNRQLLLLLDNCEHLVGACALLADTLLKACSQLTIMATSREPLGIAGEHLWRVPSLLMPEPDKLPGEEKDLAAVLMEYDACRLFVERAVAQRQDFVLTRRNVPVVGHLCRQLDGIPLAIELAAARVRSLTVEEIDGKLDHRFRLLTGGSRTALPRQQTLRALIDWSYDLLTGQEKVLLCRLSVFAGGWTLEAAEAVGIGPDVEDWEVPDLLMSLVDKSLIVAEQEQGHTRYGLLETVRQYARDRLVESGESESVHERHQAYFQTFAAAAPAHLRAAEQATWLHYLEREHDNLRAALAWGSNEAALRMAGDLMKFWYIRGYHSEGRKWLVNTLASPGNQAPSQARSEALFAAGTLARFQNDYVAARSFFEECLLLYRKLEKKRGMAGTLGNLGIIAREQGDLVAARSFFEESMALYKELENKLGIANSFLSLGSVAYNMGDYTAAGALYEESLVLYRGLEDKFGIASSVYNLGVFALKQDDNALARIMIEESLALNRELKNKQGIACSLETLGSIAEAQGDYATAQELAEAALALFLELGDRLHIANSLEVFAKRASITEPTGRAPCLWGAAEALREAISAPMFPSNHADYHQLVTQFRSTMGEAAFTVAWEEGRAMTMEQAVEYALGEEN